MAVTSVSSTSLSKEEAFRQSEGSVRLEGINPLDHADYRDLKARVLAGEITSEQALVFLLEGRRKSHIAAA